MPNYDLNTIGRAAYEFETGPKLELNPVQLGQLSSATAQWFVAHECAHLQMPPLLNSEVRADCIATEELSREGLITRADLKVIEAELSQFEGDGAGHLPSALRANSIERCVKQWKRRS